MRKHRWFRRALPRLRVFVQKTTSPVRGPVFFLALVVVPWFAFSGALMAQSPEVCVFDPEPAIPMSVVTARPTTLTRVAAANADCTTFYIRLTQRCWGEYNRCRCRFQGRGKGRGKVRECTPQPVATCKGNRSGCNKGAERKRKKCVRDKRRGGG